MKIFILITVLLVMPALPAMAETKLESVIAKYPDAIASVTRDIKQWHDMEHPSCQMKGVISARIEKRDKETSTEIWTVEGCDEKKFQYEVLIIAGPYGRSFSDSVSNADGSPMHIDKSP